jgi:hypothetical protein
MHSEICPICHGKGEIGTGQHNTTGETKKTCHGCHGKGWIEVSNGFYPIVVQPHPANPYPSFPFPWCPTIITYPYSNY